jgi:hypothetical protein
MEAAETAPNSRARRHRDRPGRARPRYPTAAHPPSRRSHPIRPPTRHRGLASPARSKSSRLHEGRPPACAAPGSTRCSSAPEDGPCGGGPPSKRRRLGSQRERLASALRTEAIHRGHSTTRAWRAKRSLLQDEPRTPRRAGPLRSGAPCPEAIATPTLAQGVLGNARAGVGHDARSCSSFLHVLRSERCLGDRS